MTESELRQKVVSVARSWLGKKESDGSHREILAVYNSHTPLARGYKVRDTDPWCAVFVSAVAIRAGLTGLIPTECSCSRQIALFQGLGRWVEEDAYVPSPGDLIYYDWQDSGRGDNTGAPDHVGIVTACDGKTVTVVEGNYDDRVKERKLAVNGRYIRGYACPNYAAAAAPEPWYAAAQAWAEANGLADGTRPLDPCTRAEVWVMLRRLKEGA